MGAPALEGVNWREVRSACESGLTFAKASQVFGINANAIKARSAREEWLTSARMANATAAAASTATSTEGLQPQRNQAPKTAQIVAESLAERQEMHRSLVQRVTDKLWRATEKAPPSVESIGDLEKLQKITRLNLSMDTGEAKVSLNIWGGTSLAGADSLGGVREVQEVGEAEE